MPYAVCNDVEIYYDTFGNAANPAMLLIMGLGMQVTGWDDAFCKMLEAHGFFVIRYDHRDIGLSTKVKSDDLPNIFAAATGDTSSLDFTLEDLADDASALLSALGVEGAHIVGASMGAMVAQLLTIRHPEQVLSLASIMSTTGEVGVGGASEEALAALVQPGAAETREEVIEAVMAVHRVIESPKFPVTDRQLRAFVTRDYDRAYSQFGALRQLAAILAARDRTEALGRVDVPTVVIHGNRDVLVDVSGGEATARAIPDAKLAVIDGMGHTLPFQKWPEIIALIVSNAH